MFNNMCETELLIKFLIRKNKQSIYVSMSYDESYRRTMALLCRWYVGTTYLLYNKTFLK